MSSEKSDDDYDSAYQPLSFDEIDALFWPPSDSEAVPVPSYDLLVTTLSNCLDLDFQAVQICVKESLDKLNIGYTHKEKSFSNAKISAFILQLYVEDLRMKNPGLDINFDHILPQKKDGEELDIKKVWADACKEE
ncbi:hypothetical protein HON22_00455 [Candidatus Peregrinibacteria bacterium]|jgi:hypothetical protein|nr:hypothetical protein [Candidatus Peregrinibacteria bacterium]